MKGKEWEARNGQEGMKLKARNGIECKKWNRMEWNGMEEMEGKQWKENKKGWQGMGMKVKKEQRQEGRDKCF